MATSKLTASQINGAHIYHFKNQTVYHDSLFDKAYIITNDNARLFQFFSTRLPISIFVGCILFFTVNNIYVSIIISIILFIVLSILFRTILLRNCPDYKNFEKPSKEPFLIEKSKQFDLNRLYSISFLGIVIAICLFLNMKNVELNLANTITYYVLIVICIVVAIVSLIIAIIKKKNNL